MTHASAIKAEAAEALVSFEFKGTTYKVDPDFDVDVIEYVEDGKWMAAIKTLLGADQYATFKKGKPKKSDLEKMVEAVMNAVGVSSGE